MSAVQYLLFDKPPQAFDQIKVGRIGRQAKEFDFSPIQNRKLERSEYTLSDALLSLRQAELRYSAIIEVIASTLPGFKYQFIAGWIPTDYSVVFTQKTSQNLSIRSLRDRSRVVPRCDGGRYFQEAFFA